MVLDGVRKLMNPSNKRTVGNHLSTLVLCTQSCNQDIPGRWVILPECKAGGNPVHGPDSVRNDANVLELILNCFGGVFGRVEHSMDIIKMRSKVQLTRMAVQNSVVEALQKTHVGMRHAIAVREQS
ncbi:hypothetical protein FPOAC2_13379 [Fusarium poae]|jgi:hypothetical protein